MPNPSKISPRLFIFLIPALLICFGEPALAQNEAPPEAPEDPCLSDPKCKELVESGRSLSQSNLYERALVVYQAAYALYPVPWLCINIGRVQHKLGRYSDAIFNYRRFLESPPQTGDDGDRTRASEFLRQAESELNEQADRRAQAQAAAVPLVTTETPPPFYKRWWFGLIIGSVVAGVGTGLTVWLVTRPASPTPDPMAPAGVTVVRQSF